LAGRHGHRRAVPAATCAEERGGQEVIRRPGRPAATTQGPILTIVPLARNDRARASQGGDSPARVRRAGTRRRAFAGRGLRASSPGGDAGPPRRAGLPRSASTESGLHGGRVEVVQDQERNRDAEELAGNLRATADRQYDRDERKYLARDAEDPAPR
jgi:hypothetical protein